MSQWKPVFNGAIGKSMIAIDKGDSGTYRVTTCRKHTEVEIQVHGATPDELARNLVREAAFPEEEARRIVHQVMQ